MLRRTLLTGLFGLAASPVLAARNWDGLFAPSVSSIDSLLITVDITTQEMVVTGGLRTLFDFDVSTGRKGYSTPTGSFRPIRMHKMWYSSKYENSPMPWAIFFHGGYAIHGTGDIKHLGKVASHGCVRLHPDNAKKLYDLVKKVGMANTKVVLLRS
ncbi:MAG: L,D-transpeptidase [Devosia sp.]